MVSKLRKWILEDGFTYFSSTTRCHDRYLRELTGGHVVTQAKMIDAQVQQIYRRGKFIIFDMGGMNAKGPVMVCHNAMSGFWDVDYEPWTFDYVEGKRQSKDSDVRVEILAIRQGRDGRSAESCRFRFHDARKFGSLRYFESKDLMPKSFYLLGPEAIATPCMQPTAVGTWNVLDLGIILDRNKRSIKEILMDQNNVAGIGNIYANEALWDAGIDPRRPGKDLTRDEMWRLFKSCQLVLQDALPSLDYSLLCVYRREKCPNCGSGIIAEKIKGRGTYRCPRCQR